MRGRTADLTGGAKELTARAKGEENPVFRHEMLEKALSLSPDDAEAVYGLLTLGRLYLRDGRSIDYSLIKCYLFHAFEHPEKHAEEERRAMAEELFHHPLLEKWLALGGDIGRYLADLSAEYVRLFIEGERAHLPGAFGLTLGRREEHLAIPAADVIENIFLCPFLNESEKKLASGAFYRAFTRMHGAKALDRRLPAEITGLLE